jgi:hypothetical protein
MSESEERRVVEIISNWITYHCLSGNLVITGQIDTNVLAKEIISVAPSAPDASIPVQRLPE